MSSDFTTMPIFTEEEGTKGIAAVAFQEVAVTLEHEQQTSELVLDGGRIGSPASAHQRVQDLSAFPAIGVLAEMTQDVSGRGGIALVELLVQALAPCVELAEAIGHQEMGEGCVDRFGIGLGRTGIDECMEDDLQVVRKGPAHSLDDESSLLGGDRQAIALAQ